MFMQQAWCNTVIRDTSMHDGACSMRDYAALHHVWGNGWRGINLVRRFFVQPCGLPHADTTDYLAIDETS